MTKRGFNCPKCNKVLKDGEGERCGACEAKKTFACIPGATSREYLTEEDLTLEESKCLYDLKKEGCDTEDTCVPMVEGISKDKCKYWVEVAIERRLKVRRSEDH